ncbi:DUF4097 family beta strand repeat-containing protein [Actinoplanes solisilvae]|uniref:DUF4097 family beta strand repeat-containing protein n=1 Tax=Actinoplanes solisilvae TaxID=2486853 RepID=UPI000FDA5FB6|nr:DUF4097 family beta strand repeat-containing protein [Actinoplanes solisilvae]
MHTFNTPAAISAVLDIPAGRIRILAEDRADTTVEVLPANAAKSRDVKVAEQTTVAYDGGVLRVEVPKQNQYFGASGSVEVTVHLPVGSRLDAKAAAAELHTAGRLGDVEFTGAHGVIKLDEVAGLRLTAYVGDVEIGRLGGSAEVSTQQGDIRVGAASGGTLVLRTQAGSITVVAAAGVSATLDASTARGRIDNSLKNDGSAELKIQATTSYGDITARSL